MMIEKTLLPHGNFPQGNNNLHVVSTAIIRLGCGYARRFDRFFMHHYALFAIMKFAGR